MAELTDRQAEVLAFINEYGRKNQMPPTRKEIAERFHFASENAANDHVIALARKGCLELVRGVSRGIRITPAGIIVQTNESRHG